MIIRLLLVYLRLPLLVTRHMLAYADTTTLTPDFCSVPGAVLNTGYKVNVYTFNPTATTALASRFYTPSYKNLQKTTSKTDVMDSMYFKSPSASWKATILGMVIPRTGVVIEILAYILAPETGFFVLFSGSIIDDGLMVFFGEDNAFDCCDFDNVLKYKNYIMYTQYGIDGEQKGITAYLYLTKAKLYPIRLVYSNAQGSLYFNLILSFPGGHYDIMNGNWLYNINSKLITDCTNTNANGAPTNSLGQPTNSKGQPTNSLGQPTNSLGQPTNSLDQPTNSNGVPTRSYGNPIAPTNSDGVPTITQTTLSTYTSPVAGCGINPLSMTFGVSANVYYYNTLETTALDSTDYFNQYASLTKSYSKTHTGSIQIAAAEDSEITGLGMTFAPSGSIVEILAYLYIKDTGFHTFESYNVNGGVMIFIGQDAFVCGSMESLSNTFNYLLFLKKTSRFKKWI